MHVCAGLGYARHRWCCACWTGVGAIGCNIISGGKIETPTAINVPSNRVRVVPGNVMVEGVKLLKNVTSPSSHRSMQILVVYGWKFSSPNVGVGQWKNV